MAWPTEAGSLIRTRRRMPAPVPARLRSRVQSAPFASFPNKFDGLRIYGSGANVDGGVQTSEASNLGGFRSSSELLSLAPFGAMSTIIIERIAEGNIPGLGALDTDGAGRFRWTAPGSSTPGPWTPCNDGGSAILEDGATPAAAIRVRRSGAAPSVGSRSVKVLEIYNGSFGGNNVASPQRAAGQDVYRAIFLKNSSPGSFFLRIYLNALGTQRTVGGGGYSNVGAITLPVSGALDDWPATGYVCNLSTGEVLYYSAKTPISAPTGLTVPAAGRDIYAEVGGGAAGTAGDTLYPIPGIRIATETVSSQPTGSIQNITNEANAPTGRTFVHPAYEGDANVIQVNPLLSGNIVGLWIQRHVMAGSVAAALIQNQIVVDHIPLGY